MHPEVKKSTPAKISAIGFIVVIIFGNLWLANAILGTPMPFWVSYGFFSGVVVVVVGGVGLAMVMLNARIDGNKDDSGS